MRRPNVLLIVLDAARADAFEPYGAAAGSTPAIADLARGGVARRDAFATASWTVPSHASMLTGMLPRSTGLMQAPGGTPHGCRPQMEALRERLLPEVLRRAGYATGGVSTNLWLTPRSGFATGFDEFEVVGGRHQPGMGGNGIRDRVRRAATSVLAREDDGAREAGSVLRRWLARERSQPFFWFVNLIECHSPYLPPRPFNPLGALDRVRATNEAGRHLTLDAIWRVCAGGWDIPDAALARMRELYAASVRALDAWVEHVVSALDDAGELDNTMIIVTADHGENLGEGGLIGHAYSLDDRLIRIPWIVHGPGARSATGATSLVELPAFIASGIGLDRHPWTEAATPDGIAVAEFDPPAGPEDPRVLDAVARWGLGADAVARITTALTCATDGRHKLLRRGDAEELYDLERDPLELAPGRAEAGPASVVERLRDAMRIDRKPAAASSSPGNAPSAQELAELEERMRRLGYM